ncbi:metallophosphoesterase, partial [Acidobacteriota bacterium]
MLFWSCAVNYPGIHLVEQAPLEDVDVRLFLIGDTGAPDPDFEPVLVSLESQISKDPLKSVVVFLGDNVYPSGLPLSSDPDWAEARRRLDVQIELLRTNKVKGIFIPGNHDWDKYGLEGWKAIVRQEHFIKNNSKGYALLLPGGGCPGPVVMDVGETLRLVILDTQWWLHTKSKPLGPSSDCSAASEAQVINLLRKALHEAGSRKVVVAMHHPLQTGGKHGGYFKWHHHIFPLRELKSWLWIPLPILGSVYPIARKSGISRQDLSSRAYSAMRESLRKVFIENPPLGVAAGHEHNLQVLHGESSRYLLISGAGYMGHVSSPHWLK